MSWMGSECRHAGRVSECIGHAEMALCGYNKSYCSPKLELIFPRVSDQANVTEKHSLLLFSGSPEAPALPSHPHSHAQHRSTCCCPTGVQGGKQNGVTHIQQKYCIGFGKFVYLIKNFKNCIKLKSMMQQIQRLTVWASDRWPLPSRSKVLNK